LTGLACLTRSTGIVLVPIIGLLLWTAVRDRWSVRALVAPAIVAVVAAVVIAPWAIRNQVKLHRFVPFASADAFTLVGTYNDAARTDARHPSAFRPYPQIPKYAALYTDKSLTEAEVYDRLRTGATDYMRAHPGYVAMTVLRNTRRLLELEGWRYSRLTNASIGFGRRLSDATVIAFWIAAVLAVVGAFTAAARRVPWPLWLAPILFAAMTAVAVGTTRYRMPIEPFVVLLAAAGVVAIADRFRGARA
jgi:4-amino-4-deoxy-L-arabinose transferase-like glycosyltransferase